MTVYATLVRMPRPVSVARERWELPDGDFLDVDRVPGATSDAPLVLILHGLEGSSRAGYVRGLLAELAARGLAAAAMNFRGCSGELNRLPRFYHSGETGDLAAAVGRLIAERSERRLGIVGFSLGGNILAKWFGEQGDRIPPQVRAGMAISPPIDLAGSASILDAPGFWPAIYRGRFLRSLKRKALAKALRFPSRIDAGAARSSATFQEFDDRVTAPLHGFRDAEEYWRLCSSGPLLRKVRRRLHVLLAEDDPFMPRLQIEASPDVSVELTPAGGHVAFVEGWPWRGGRYAERRAADLMAEALSEPSRAASVQASRAS